MWKGQSCTDSSSPRALPAVDVEKHLPEPRSAEGKGFLAEGGCEAAPAELSLAWTSKVL